MRRIAYEKYLQAIRKRKGWKRLFGGVVSFAKKFVNFKTCRTCTGALDPFYDLNFSYSAWLADSRILPRFLLCLFEHYVCFISIFCGSKFWVYRSLDHNSQQLTHVLVEGTPPQSVSVRESCTSDNSFAFRGASAPKVRSDSCLDIQVPHSWMLLSIFFTGGIWL